MLQLHFVAPCRQTPPPQSAVPGLFSFRQQRPVHLRAPSLQLTFILYRQLRSPAPPQPRHRCSHYNHLRHHHHSCNWSLRHHHSHDRSPSHHHHQSHIHRRHWLLPPQRHGRYVHVRFMHRHLRAHCSIRLAHSSVSCMTLKRMRVDNWFVSCVESVFVFFF